jgi:hypothetical protein
LHTALLTKSCSITKHNKRNIFNSHIHSRTRIDYTRWFKYDRNKLWLVYTQIVPVIFEPPCICFYSVLFWRPGKASAVIHLMSWDMKTCILADKFQCLR